MIIIGLTGGIACGKSTVTNILLKNNIKVIDADKIAHRLLEPLSGCWMKVVDRFGDVLDMQTRIIDRKKLGSIIFNDEKARKDLNDIMHPYIKYEIETQIDLCKQTDLRIIVLDIPLLIETGWHEQCDKVWLVALDHDVQLQRLMKRNNLSEAEAIARINSQMSLEEKKQYADFIIDNSGTIEETEEIVHKLLINL